MAGRAPRYHSGFAGSRNAMPNEYLMGYCQLFIPFLISSKIRIVTRGGGI